MGFFPYDRSVLALPIDAQTAEDLLTLSTSESQTYHELIQARRNVSIEKFQGKIKSGKFSISKKVYYPQNYLPLINGEIESTSTGCVVITNFDMFPGTKFLFYLWSFVMVVIALVFFLVKPNYLYSSIALFFFIANYIVAIANFNMHVKDSKKILREVFEL